jgi:hypothetical protein
MTVQNFYLQAVIAAAAHSVATLRAARRRVTALAKLPSAVLDFAF